MTQKRDNRGFDRRSVLKSLSAGTATVATGGVAAASGTPSNDESPLTEEERAERRAPYEDLGTARSLVSDNTERLLERLADRGYLPAGRARALQMNRLETGFRKAAKQSQRGHNDVRVKTVHHENFGTKVIVDTKVRHAQYTVRISVSTDSETASAIVSTDDGVEAFLKETDAGIEDVTTTASGECGEICDDCCGFWDCTQEHKVIYDCPGSCQTACGCLVAGVTYCCEDGCGALCTC